MGTHYFYIMWLPLRKRQYAVVLQWLGCGQGQGLKAKAKATTPRPRLRPQPPRPRPQPSRPRPTFCGLRPRPRPNITEINILYTNSHKIFRAYVAIQSVFVQLIISTLPLSRLAAHIISKQLSNFFSHGCDGTLIREDTNVKKHRQKMLSTVDCEPLIVFIANRSCNTT